MRLSELQWHMRSALVQAEKAYKLDEVPVGAMVVNQFGDVISSAHNEKEQNHDPVGHAEILAIRRAAEKNEAWRLTEHTLIVTLEPCPMCLAAMVQARISRCVFGAYDAKGGALSLGLNLNNDPRLNHNFSIVGGVMHWDCSSILSRYFKEKRHNYKLKRKV